MDGTGETWGTDLISVASSIRIWLALVEPTKRIVVGADVLRHPEVPSNGAAEPPTECRMADNPIFWNAVYPQSE
jgi:hypothetical protein